MAIADFQLVVVLSSVTLLRYQLLSDIPAICTLYTHVGNNAFIHPRIGDDSFVS
jgi:hypothetical protein